MRVRIARLIWIVAVVLVALATVLYGLNDSILAPPFDPVAPALALVAPGMGAIILARQPGNRFGWLLSATAVLAFGFFAEQYATYTLVSGSASLPGATWMAWLGTWVWAPATLSLRTVALLWFPVGRVPQGHWRWVVVTVSALVAATTVLTALTPGTLPGYPAENPLGSPLVPEGSAALASWGVLALSPICLLGLLVNYRRGDDECQDMFRPFVIAGVLAVTVPVILLPLGAVHVGLYQALSLIAMVALPAAVLVAMIRHRLYGLSGSEVTLLVDRLLVGAGVVLALTGLYWAGVELLGVSPLLVIMAAAVAVSPLRWLFQQGIARMRTTSRASAALVDLGRRLESVVAPEDVLPAIVDTVASALDLP